MVVVLGADMQSQDVAVAVAVAVIITIHAALTLCMKRDERAGACLMHA